MKRKILITLLSLFSVALFAQTIEDKAEQIAYKHERNTIFAIKEGKKFHAFKYDDSITHLGYAVFDGKPTKAKEFAFLDDETDKHMSESYFFVVEDDIYYLFYKTYMSDVKLILSNKLVKPKEGIAKQLATSMTKTVEEPEEEISEAEPESEEESDDEDDDSGGLAWYWYVVIFWVLFGGFSSSKS